MFRGDTFCLDEGQVWHSKPMEVVIPGCFCGVLVGRISQLPRPAGGVSDLSNRELVLSLLLLVVGLHSLVQLQKEGGRTLLHWGCSAATSIGPHCHPCLCCPHICPQLDQSLQFLQKRFQEQGLPSDRFSGAVNQFPTCSSNEAGVHVLKQL